MTTDFYVNISGYKFITLGAEILPALSQRVSQQAKACTLKGTILLGTEGINAFLSGARDQIDEFIKFIKGVPEFEDLHFKESVSDSAPFEKLIVRIKDEIVTMGNKIKPQEGTAPYLSPAELKNWYEQGREFLVLDTRNNYEYALGTFDEAIELNIESFREFPDALMSLPEHMKNKPVVTFCTGGIRCEKAAEFMQQKGFKQVYQLEGGILNYFEKVGGDYYHGDCFVFDKRLTVNSQLQPTQTVRCFRHAQDESADQRAKGVECPYCLHIRKSRMNEAHDTQPATA